MDEKTTMETRRTANKEGFASHTTPALHGAGLWTRVKAFAWDYPIIAVYLILLVATGSLLNRFFPQTAAGLFGSPLRGQMVGFLLLTLPVSLYFALLEASEKQATLGKRRMKLRVVDIRGQRLSLARALGRTALKFIPWELAHTCIWQAGAAPGLTTAGFVLVWVLVFANAASLLVDPSRQTLYDRLAGTFVVAENQLEVGTPL